MPTYQQIIMTIPKCSGEYLVKLMRNHAKTIMENGGNVRGIENHGIKPLAERTRL
jgi:ribosomal protein S6